MQFSSVVGALILLTVGNNPLTWIPMRSSLYPYTIRQASSFRHVVLRDALNRPSDFFFPSLGSYTTNVNIYAGTKGASLDTRKWRTSEWVRIGGRRLPLKGRDFRGIAGHWTIEQVTVTGCGLTWYLTMSYASQYRSLRSTMVHMLQSFRSTCQRSSPDRAIR